MAMTGMYPGEAGKWEERGDAGIPSCDLTRERAHPCAPAGLSVGGRLLDHALPHVPFDRLPGRVGFVGIAFSWAVSALTRLAIQKAPKVSERSLPIIVSVTWW